MPVAAIGIDLGTASTRVAIWQNGKVEIIQDADGGDSFPSSVTFDDHNQTRLLGRKARIRESPKLSLVFDNVKQHLEKCRCDDSSECSAAKSTEKVISSSVEAVALIFHRVVGNVAIYFKSSLETMKIWATISVPASFNENQRQVIRDAAKLVGITILSMPSTPSAICYAWAHDDGNVIKSEFER
jgi:molecular chaperone DnaK (HSP70)